MPYPNTPGLLVSALARLRRTGSWAATRGFPWLAAAALAGYVLFLAAHTNAVARGSDSSGYLNSARLFAAGQLQARLRVPEELGPANRLPRREEFTPLGFIPSTDPNRIIPTYPTGLPLHYAVAAGIFGWDAGPVLLELLAAAGAVWLTYLLARQLGVSPSLAAAGALTLAVFPVFLFTSIQALSDTLATTWSLAALCLALRGRPSTPRAAAAGAAFAIAVLVRPTNLLFTPALLCLLGGNWRRLGAFVLAGVPGAAWFLLYNHHQYGGAFQSGYGDILSAFSPVHSLPTLRHFAWWLALLLPPLVLVLPVAAMLPGTAHRREAAALLLAFATMTGFFLFYDISRGAWWYLRFLLPVIPALIVTGLLGLEQLARGPGARWPRAFRPMAALLLAGWALGNSVHWSRQLGVFGVRQQEQTYEHVARAARDRLPPDALLVTFTLSGALYYYTPFSILRGDVVPPESFARYATGVRSAGRPMWAVLFEFEEEDVLRHHCPGNWEKLFAVANVGFWQLR